MYRSNKVYSYINETTLKQWQEALRSGDYKPTGGQLVRGNQHGRRYCCLGVAEVVVKDIRGTEPICKYSRHMLCRIRSVHDAYEEEYFFINGWIQEQLALLNDKIQETGDESMLDGYSSSFEMIADLLDLVPMGVLQSNGYTKYSFACNEEVFNLMRYLCVMVYMNVINTWLSPNDIKHKKGQIQLLQSLLKKVVVNSTTPIIEDFINADEPFGVHNSKPSFLLTKGNF